MNLTHQAIDFHKTYNDTKLKEFVTHIKTSNCLVSFIYETVKDFNKVIFTSIFFLCLKIINKYTKNEVLLLHDGKVLLCEI